MTEMNMGTLVLVALLSGLAGWGVMSVAVAKEDGRLAGVERSFGA